MNAEFYLIMNERNSLSSSFLPKRSNMNDLRIRHQLLIILCLIMLLPFSAFAQIDCSRMPHWVTLNNGLQFNQKHIFCGEWNQNRPKGFHSRPGGNNPSVIAHLTIQSEPNAAGIYTARWSYKKQPDKNKFSSMFPDNCTITQILNSISHATANSKTQCPSGSPEWIQCGQNKPEVNQEENSAYCSKDGQNFTIGFKPSKHGKINTAFPIFE